MAYSHNLPFVDLPKKGRRLCSGAQQFPTRLRTGQLVGEAQAAGHPPQKGCRAFGGFRMFKKEGSNFLRSAMLVDLECYFVGISDIILISNLISTDIQAN